MESFEVSWELIVLYLLIVFAVGIWAARTRVNSIDDMAVAGRAGGTWLVALSVAATWINGASLIIVSGVGKNFGLGSYWIAGPFMAATIWAGYYIVPRLRQARIITIPEFFGRFFGPRTHLLALLLNMLRDMGVTAGVIGALALISSEILDITIVEALLLTYVLMLAYLFLGGMWAVLVTDAIQFVIVVIASLWLILASLSKVGGMFAITRQVEPQMLEIVGPAGLPQVVGWAILGLGIAVGYQSLIQRGLAATDRRSAQKGFLYGGILGVIWYMIPVLLGLCARILYGADIPADQVFLRLMYDHGGSFASILVISIFAASMSTLDSTVNTISSNLSIDIYARYIDPSAGKKRQLWVYRINILVVGLLAALLYYGFPVLLELFWLGGRIMGASLTPALIVLILYPRARRAPKTVFVSMVLGASAVVLWQFLPGSVEQAATFVLIWTVDPILVGLPICLMSLWLGIRWETAENKEGLTA